MIDDVASAWVKQSARDFKQAELSRDAGHAEWACYAAMQAAEKRLKAALLAAGDSGLFGHNLIRMLERLSSLSDAVVADDLKSAARRLSQYNVTTRYPLGDDTIAPLDLFDAVQADEALAAARLVIDWADSLLQARS